MRRLAPARLLSATKELRTSTAEETAMALYTHGNMFVHAVKALNSAMPKETHETLRETQQVPRSSLHCSSENGKRFQPANTCDGNCSLALSRII